MKTRKISAIIAMFLILAMLFTACGTTASTSTNSNASSSSSTSSGKSDSSAKEVVNVAFELPLSGAGGGWNGNLFMAGIEMGQAMVADRLDAIGVEINPVINDHECSPDVGSVNIVKDIDMYDCPIAICQFGGILAAMAPICEENEVVLINNRGSQSNLYGLSDWLYNLYPSNILYAKALATYLHEEEGFTKLAFLVVGNNSTAADQLATISAAWEDMGLDIVANVETAADATDYLSVCSQILNAGAEVVVMCNTDDTLTQRQINQFLQLPGGSDLCFAVSGSGNPYYAGSDCPNRCFLSDPIIDAPQDVIDDYNNNHLVEGFDWTAGGGYVSASINTYLIITQLCEYLHEQGLEYTGPNFKKALDDLGEYDILVGSFVLGEGNCISVGTEIFETVNGDAKVVKTYDANAFAG